MINCDGNCTEHFGEVRRVNVFDPETSHDWGDFNYCENAVMSDQGKGFIVTDIEAD